MSKNLSRLVEKFWESEDVDSQVSFTKSEEECEKHFVSNYKPLSSGRFVVKLPFKNNSCCLDLSYKIALKRVLNFEK